MVKRICYRHFCRQIASKIEAQDAGLAHNLTVDEIGDGEWTAVTSK